ncbi:hypothetical protein CJ209_03780 [Fusobacterium nucleatum]|uniref:Uncharacterized protein n=1 Tax=Fusobacterium nucleatum TaxID=851 RepID=A0A2N6TM74_FUSNU|nr:hypothetical protein CJ209_03780 [Fusobacterium nucleatum]
MRCKFSKLADKSASNTLRFARLILFNFYPKIWNVTHLFFIYHSLFVIIYFLNFLKHFHIFL